MSLRSLRSFLIGSLATKTLKISRFIAQLFDKDLTTFITKPRNERTLEEKLLLAQGDLLSGRVMPKN